MVNDMAFKFSYKSLAQLNHPEFDKGLRRVFMGAIGDSAIDFGVLQTLRTKQEQEFLVQSGASQTMNSKHLEGKAVDVFAWVDGDVSWDPKFYIQIAESVRHSAIREGLVVRWGGAWHCYDIGGYDKGMNQLHQDYVDLRKQQNKAIFADFGHFERA